MDLLADAVEIFFAALYIMLLIRILLSWFPIRKDNKFAELLYAFTEPVLAPVRRLVHKSPLGGPGMVLDFSPIIVFILLRLASSLIVPFIRSL
jgi:YggT family protein